MKNRKREFRLFLLMVIVVLMIASASWGSVMAQEEYPSKPVIMIVARGVGGGTDLAARGLQPYLQEALGTPVVVENKPGAGNLVAISYITEQKPDGYQILVDGFPILIINQLLHPEHGDPANLVPVGSWLNDDTNPFLVAGSSPYDSFEEFKNAMEGKTVKLGISSGTGSADHVAWVLLKEETGLDFIPVPFDSAGECIIQLQGGHIDCAFASIAAAFTPVKDGQVKVFAITSAERNSLWPNVPTFREIGYDVMIQFRVGAWAPPGTPDVIVNVLSNAIVEAASNPKFVAWAEEVGLAIGKPMNAEEWTNLNQEEMSRMKMLVPKLQENPLG